MAITFLASSGLTALETVFAADGTTVHICGRGKSTKPTHIVVSNDHVKPWIWPSEGGQPLVVPRNLHLLNGRMLPLVTGRNRRRWQVCCVDVISRSVVEAAGLQFDDDAGFVDLDVDAAGTAILLCMMAYDAASMSVYTDQQGWRDVDCHCLTCVPVTGAIWQGGTTAAVCCHLGEDYGDATYSLDWDDLALGATNEVSLAAADDEAAAELIKLGDYGNWQEIKKYGPIRRDAMIAAVTNSRGLPWWAGMQGRTTTLVWLSDLFPQQRAVIASQALAGAVFDGKLKTVLWALDNDADLSWGGSILHLAVMSGNEDVVRALLAAGADPAVIEEGESVLEYAEGYGWDAITELIRAAL